MSTNLPTDIAATYPDASPGDAQHQQHHDEIHARLNGLDGEIAGAAGAVGARVTLAVAQTIPAATSTVVNFGSETFDTGGLHDNATNPSRITAPVAGLYVVHGAAGFASNATGYRSARIVVSGVLRSIASVRADDTPGLPTRLQVSDILMLAAGDYVELAVVHGAGAALDLEVTYTYLAVTRAGAV